MLDAGGAVKRFESARIIPLKLGCLQHEVGNLLLAVPVWRIGRADSGDITHWVKYTKKTINCRFRSGSCAQPFFICGFCFPGF